MFNSVRSPFILLFLVCDSSQIFYVGGHQNVTGWGMAESLFTYSIGKLGPSRPIRRQKDFWTWGAELVLRLT